jgi:hypothetical protein
VGHRARGQAHPLGQPALAKLKLCSRHEARNWGACVRRLENTSDVRTLCDCADRLSARGNEAKRRSLGSLTAWDRSASSTTHGVVEGEDTLEARGCGNEAGKQKALERRLTVAARKIGRPRPRVHQHLPAPRSKVGSKRDGRWWLQGWAGRTCGGGAAAKGRERTRPGGWHFQPRANH